MTCYLHHPVPYYINKILQCDNTSSHFNSLQFDEGFSRKHRRVNEQSSKIKYRLRSGRNTLVAAPVTLFHNAVAAGELLPEIEDVEERRLRIVDGPIVAEIVPLDSTNYS